MNQFEVILERNSVSKTLTKNPNGMDSLIISYTRNETYHSILRTVTNSLKFVKTGLENLDEGGYQFILDAYHADGIKASVSIIINEWNPFKLVYELFYNGVLLYEPTKWGLEFAPDQIEIAIIDSAKLQTFKSNEEIEIDLNSTNSLNGSSIGSFSNSPKTATLLPIDIYLISDNSGSYFGSGVNYVSSQLTILSDYYGVLSNNEIGDRLKISPAPTDSIIYENDLTYNTFIYFNKFIGNNIDTLVIVGDSVTSWEFTKTLIITSYDNIGNVDSVYENELVNISGIGRNNGTEYRSDFDFTVPEITALVGGNITMLTKCVLSAIASNVQKRIITRTNVTESTIIERTDGENSSSVSMYLPFEAFEKGFQITTNEINTSKLIDSDVFGRTDSEHTSYPINGEYAYYSYNIGWNIRGYPNKSFNTNFKDLFTSYDSLFSLTLIYNRINDKIEIKKRIDAYKLEEILSLDSISNFKIEPSDISYFNRIISGYLKQTFEDFQGVNEVNLESEHYIDMLSKNKVDIRSIASASGIAIELLRRKPYTRNTSEDTKNDNTNFIIELDSSLNMIQGVSNYSGFLGGEQYPNLSITPRENLIRHGYFIQTPLYFHQTQLINKSKYQKDSDITYTNQNGDLVNELSNIELTELPTLRVVPEVYKFTSIFNSAIIAQLNSDPHGYISFFYNGVTYKGFIISIDGSPVKKTAEYILIKANI